MYTCSNQLITFGIETSDSKYAYRLFPIDKRMPIFVMFDRNMQLTKRPDALVYRCSVISSNYSIRIMRLLINHLRLTNYMYQNHTNGR